MELESPQIRDPGIIGSLLSSAEGSPVAPQDLPRLWQVCRVRLLCPGAASLTRNPNTPATIRGAWGRALGLGASDSALAGGPCDWPAPCAYDLFFNAQGALTSRLEIPKPFVIGLDMAGRNLLVTLSLFGAACDWAGEAADALIRALRGGLDQGQARQAVAVAGRDIAVAQGVEPPLGAEGLSLEFLSPLALRDGEAVHSDPVSLLTGAANRVGGLARWHGVRLDLDPAALKAEAVAVGGLARWTDLREPAPWRRGSRAQGRGHQMSGVLGTLHLPPVSDDMAAILACAGTCHAGSRTAHGLGRFRLVGKS